MRKVVALSICALVFVAGAYAQATAGLGSVSGTVRDATGAVIPGATVVVANEGMGIRRNMNTTDAGIFAAPALTPASGYSITVTKQGFATYEVKDFAILVGQNVDFKVGLQIGSATTKVDVTAEAPLVEDTKSGVTSTVGSDQIDSLPINGRRVDSFVLLTPAVTNDGEFGLISFRGIAAGNAFLTDGNDTTNSFYNENAGRTRIGSQLSQDAVQEFQVLSNGFSAEFGRAMGGVINTVTKSGGNNTHGTGYWFFRNRTLEAADRYSNGIKAPEWRHTAGASLGGALKKDKLFYFANFDYTDRNFPGQNRIVNNTVTDPTGNFIPAANCVPTTAPGGPTQAQCTAAINFIQKQMNVCGAAHLQPGTRVRQDRLASQRPQYVQLRFECDALGIAARYPDAGRADQRQHARQQRQFDGAGQVRQGFLDFGGHQQRGQRSAFRLVQGSPLRPRRQRSVPGRDRSALYHRSRQHRRRRPGLSAHLSERKSLPDRGQL